MVDDGLVGDQPSANPAGSVTIADLRRASDLLLEAAEQQYGSEFNLLEAAAVYADYYWNVDATAAFAMVEDPETRLTCGHVSDDVAEVAALLQRDDAIWLWHDLEHLAALLRFLAYVDRPSTHA
jgi:hypothetical protein